jgi:transcriptional regulator with AAA-type ATPase domain/tetratricopeptide (TPR) repeat protein
MDVLSELIGEDPKIVSLRQRARALLQRHQEARKLPPILIQGETGTGKGLLARLMHRAGPRAHAPFVDLNCAAVPDTLLEAELFGYERGAFTDAKQAKPGLFLVAHGGTLFLDEIGLLPRSLQSKLLTVLEQGSVRRLGATRSEPANVSIVAATNEPLLSAVREGRFREDLYHRLAVLTLELPPLRERRDDIELLAERLLGRVCSEYNLSPRTLTSEARIALRRYEWPGNVRELANVVERSVLLADADAIGAESLDLPRAGGGEASPATEPSRAEETHRDRLIEALERTGWNITRTAALLGVTRNTVRARMRLYGLRRADEAEPAPVVAPTADETGDVMPADAQLEPTAAAEVRWERRRVTFLRARIVSGAETPPPSLAARILGWVIDKVQAFGGHVSEVGQHSIVAVFGHEPAEDAPRRAATTALAVTKLLARERSRGEVPSDLSVTLAIHVEQVALARINGRPVVEQDAIRQVATVMDTLEPVPAGEIGVTAAAVAFLARHFEVSQHPGPGGTAHRLLGRWAAPGGAHRVPFIGRRPEIDMLDSLLDRVTRAQGQIVTLIGEPGIGKSRMLHEFQKSIGDEPVAIREGRCASYATHIPYFPVIQILQTVCGIDEADTIQTVDAKVLGAFRELGDAGIASVPYVQYLLFPRKGGVLADRSPEAIKTGTFEAIRQLVLAQQERRLLLLVIEDLHWIDQSSADLLASVAELTTGTRILIVATCRPGCRLPWHARSNATQIAVGPLSTVESRQLVEFVLGARSSAEGIVSRIVERGEGNPFFLDELARGLREQADDATSVAVPATVHDILATRIEDLAEGDKRLLDTAAVIGREIAVSLLQEASEVPVDDVRARLARLQAGEFLQPTRFGVDVEYAFKHVLTQEVAYASIPPDVRVRLHGRVAAAIEKLLPDTRERRPEILARHCTEARRHAEAIEHWCQAARLAVQRSAHGDAVVHLGEALKLLAHQPEDAARDGREITIQLALATSLTAARGYGAAELERTLARIRILADRLTDVAQKFFVQWALWRFHFARADFRTAEEIVAQLLGLAEGTADPVIRVGAALAVGVDKFYLGEFARAQEALGRLIDDYDRAHSAAHALRFGQDLGVAAWGFLGWADAVRGDLEGGERRAETGLELARELGHPFSLALALLLACEVHELRGDFDRVRRLSEELVSLSHARGFAFFAAIGQTHAGWARARAGDVASGVPMMQEGADLFRKLGQRVGLAHRARLAEGLLARGAVDEALDVVSDALEQRRHSDENAFASVLLTLRGEALARRGDRRSAGECLREAVDIANRQGASLFARRAAEALQRVEETS